jgi:hypothetical protein
MWLRHGDRLPKVAWLECDVNCGRSWIGTFTDTRALFHLLTVVPSTWVRGEEYWRGACIQCRRVGNEDLVLLVKDHEKGCGEKDDVLAPRTLILKRMSLASNRIEEGLSRLTQNDPNKELNSKGHRNLTLSRRCYCEPCKEKVYKARIQYDKERFRTSNRHTFEIPVETSYGQSANYIFCQSVHFISRQILLG